jgi:hypothetical protein
LQHSVGAPRGYETPALDSRTTGAGGFDFAGAFPPLVVERLIRGFPSGKGLRSMAISAGTDLPSECAEIQDRFEHDAVTLAWRGTYLIRCN